MRFSILVGSLYLPLILLLAGCEGSKERGAESRPPAAAEKGQAAQVPQVPLIQPADRRPAPDIRAAGIDGSTWRLAEQKGKVVLVDFWATWCPPCRKTIPHLIDLQSEYGGRDVAIVGISLDQGGPAVVSPFVQQAGINYPIVVDSRGEWADRFGGVDGIPAFFLIDRNGRTAGLVQGAVPKEMIQGAIDKLLREG